MFQGTLTAVITPFTSKASGAGALSVDIPTYCDLLEWQLSLGIDGIVVCGTTGESVTLSAEEKKTLIAKTVEVVKGRVPVIAGTGSNSTAQTIEATKEAKGLGVDGALIVSPYYNKPTQEGLFQHFSAVAKEGGLPVVLYNIPGRTAVEVLPATFAKLARIPGIVAVKQAVDSVVKLLELVDATDGKIALLAGDDPLVHAVFSVGGKGVISASAAAIPSEILAITKAGLAGKLDEALVAQLKALPLINALFTETNPAPVKAVLKIIGRIQDDSVRLPLVQVREETRAMLTKLFKPAM